MSLGQFNTFGLLFANERQGSAAALAHDDHDAALIRLVGLQAAVFAIRLAVLWTNHAARVHAIHLDFARQAKAFHLDRKRLAKLVSENKGCLVLHREITAELQSRQALDRIHEDGDGAAEVDES